MWNIVTVGGRNYLVDVTNCDADTVGVPDKLFLCGAAENEPGKKYTATAGSQSIVYEYDADTLSDYASSDLKLEEMPYSRADCQRNDQELWQRKREYYRDTDSYRRFTAG